MAITWQNIDTPNFRASNALTALGGRTISEAINAGGDALQNYAQRRSESATGDFTAGLQGIDDPQQLAAYLANRGEFVNAAQAAQAAQARRAGIQTSAVQAQQLEKDKIATALNQFNLDSAPKKLASELAQQAAAIASSQATANAQKYTTSKKKEEDASIAAANNILDYYARTTPPDKTGKVNMDFDLIAKFAQAPQFLLKNKKPVSTQVLRKQFNELKASFVDPVAAQIAKEKREAIAKRMQTLIEFGIGENNKPLPGLAEASTALGRGRINSKSISDRRSFVESLVGVFDKSVLPSNNVFNDTPSEEQQQIANFMLAYSDGLSNDELIQARDAANTDDTFDKDTFLETVQSFRGN